MSDVPEVFWIDTVGDQLEAEGVDPGTLWESGLQLNEGLDFGLVLVTNIGPGCRPTGPDHISRVLWRRLDSLKGWVVEEVSPRNPLFLSHWVQIWEEMC
jgi:hypothetical protein